MTIVQNVLVNQAIALLSDRLLISYKLISSDRIDDNLRATYNRRLSNPVHIAISDLIEQTISEDLADGRDVNPLLSAILTYHLKAKNIKRFDLLKENFKPFKYKCNYFMRLHEDPFGLIEQMSYGLIKN